MAPLFFRLNLFFSGFLFILTASFSEYCELVSIPLQTGCNGTVSTLANTTILRNQSRVSCYYFRFVSNSKFEENEQKLVKFSMQLTGIKNGDNPMKIEFIKNRQLESLKWSIKCDAFSGIGEFEGQFGYNVSFERVPISIYFHISLNDPNHTDQRNSCVKKQTDANTLDFVTFMSYNAKSFDETSPGEGSGDISNDPTVSTTTVMLPSELTESSQKQEDTWRIISIVFIVLTTLLLILSICLWRMLPSLKSTQVSQERPGISIHRISGEVVY